MSTDWCERRRVLDTGKTIYAHIHIYVKPGKQLIVYGKWGVVKRAERR